MFSTNNTNTFCIKRHVNHSEEFMDHDTGAHTQNIETPWR